MQTCKAYGCTRPLGGTGLKRKALEHTIDSVKMELAGYFKSSVILTFISLLLMVSCRYNRSFDSEVWKKRGVDWQLVEDREEMVADLVSSDTLIGLNRTQIIELLGEPEKSSEQEMKFLVLEKYEWNVDPEYVKYLVVEIDQNGKAVECYIVK